MEREKTLNRVCLKCADFARQLSLHRAFDGIHSQLKQNFWIYINNNAIDMAILDWCHLFGSHSDQLHWKRIIKDIDKFRGNLFKFLKISESTWRTYRENLKSYRDKNVAHIEVMPLVNVPDLTFALDSVIFYYNEVKEEIKNNGAHFVYPDDLEKYFQDCLDQTRKYISVSYASTNGLKEKVF